MSAAEAFLGYNLPLFGDWNNAEDREATQLSRLQQDLEQHRSQARCSQWRYLEERKPEDKRPPPRLQPGLVSVSSTLRTPHTKL